MRVCPWQLAPTIRHKKSELHPYIEWHYLVSSVIRSATSVYEWLICVCKTGTEEDNLDSPPSTNFSQYANTLQLL